MLRKRLLAVCCIAAIAAALPAAAAAQEISADQQKAMEAYMKLMAPNENHAFLGKFVGTWEVTTTTWAKPGAAPSVNNGTCTARLMLGGRFIEMSYQGLMFGRPFEGVQIIGYDNAQQKYVSLWLDNTSTAFYLTRGTRDAAGNAIHDTGLWPDPLTGEAGAIRAVTRFLNPDEFTYELFMIDRDGEEFKSLENRVTRKR